MTKRPFSQVDVFTATPYYGNPLAVVLNGADVSDEAMQRFAWWTNLSETTFVLPPTPEGAANGADYRVRIFTPDSELPFAGHPTLGTCHAWLQAGGVPQRADCIVQECGVGLVQIQHKGSRLTFAAPPLQRRAVDAAELAPILAALKIEVHQIIAAQHLDNGPHWLGLLLDHPDTVLALEPDHQALKNHGVKIGVASIYTVQAASNLIARSNREARAFEIQTTQLEVRAFAAPLGVNEDPVTGSLNASLAQWLIADAYLPETYTAAQGCCLGRSGIVYLQRDASGQVWVGGDVVTCIEGNVTL